MYPFPTRRTWFLRHPQKHLTQALDHRDDLTPGAQRVLANRVALHARWLLIRAILLVPLSVGAVSAAAGFLIEAFGGFEAAADAVDLFQRLSTTFATVFAALFLLAGRTADQAFHDILAVIHARNDIPPGAE